MATVTGARDQSINRRRSSSARTLRLSPDSNSCRGVRLLEPALCAVALDDFAPAADQMPVAVLWQVSHHERLQAGAVAVDGAVAVHECDMVVACAGPDQVVAVA